MKGENFNHDERIIVQNELEHHHIRKFCLEEVSLNLSEHIQIVDYDVFG
jgi:hypothetical protein